MSLLDNNLKEIPKAKTFDDVMPLLTPDIYAKAYGHGMTVPQYLEIVHPSKEDELSTFEKTFKRFGLFTKSDPARGITSSPARFFVPADHPTSAILFPAYLQQQAMIARLSSVASVERIAATTRTITGSTYQSLTIDDSGLGTGKSFRIGEGGEFPKVKFSWSQAGNTVVKHGVRLDFSYEFLRRASIELVGTLAQRLAQRDSINNFYDAVDFLENGDGSTNNPAAVSVKASALDSTNDADGEITYKAWLKWLASFDPYSVDTVVGDLNAIIACILMVRPAADTLALISALKAGTVDATAVIEEGSKYFPNVSFIVVPTANIGANTLLGIDTTAACERIIEVGSDLTETQRFINNQTEIMVMSIADNISKIWPGATKVLSLIA